MNIFQWIRAKRDLKKGKLASKDDVEIMDILTDDVQLSEIERRLSKIPPEVVLARRCRKGDYNTKDEVLRKYYRVFLDLRSFLKDLDKMDLEYFDSAGPARGITIGECMLRSAEELVDELSQIMGLVSGSRQRRIPMEGGDETE